MHRRNWHAGVFVAIVLLTSPASSSAHEHLTAGTLHLMVGWGDEPAFSGFKNSAEVDVTGADGAAIVDPAGQLAVEVTFGDARVSLPLLPVGRQPGKFRAWLVPTRPGTYAFHITGTLKGQAVDVTSTCSDKSFACVNDLSAIQFPAKDPSAGQLAERVARELPRAAGTAATARNVAIVALAGTVAALAAAFRAGRRTGRKNS